MSEKKRRRRTGCITCRQRRVKCDETTPECQRCIAANVECAGYEQRRRINLRPQLQQASSHSVPSPAGSASVPDPPSPSFRADGLPLVGFPRNPRPLQRPHTRARDVLAYHQFLFRTLPVLFPEDDLTFWRDELCEESWETEYIYDTIMALGGLHRGILLLSTSSENDRNRGLDTKVIALQSYTKALQELSEQLPEAEKSLDILVGVFVLLAYFECFSNNIPAAIGHICVASQYFASMQSKSVQSLVIEPALRKLCHICRIVLPFPRFDLSSASSSTATALLYLQTNRTAQTSLQDLIDLASRHAKVWDLIWCPIAPSRKALMPFEIHAFQGTIKHWKTVHLPQLETDIIPSNVTDGGGTAVDKFPIPPQPYAGISPQYSLVVALYYLCMARAEWLLSLIEDDSGTHELCAYLNIYKVLRLSTTPPVVDGRGDGYLSCETATIGFLPILYVAGQCSPQPVWLRWIMEKLSSIGQECLFNGNVLAKSLNALYTFEMYHNVDSSSMLERLPSPAMRVISVSIPEQNGRGFTTYYAGRKPDEQRGEADETLIQYYPLGHARWSDVHRDEVCNEEIEMYNEERITAEPFDVDWLLKQSAVRSWATWSEKVGFNIDQALRDHINGNFLLSASGEFGVK